MAIWTGTLPTFAAGEVLTAAKLQIMSDALHGVTDARASFTPTVRFGATAWTLGNAVVTCRYTQSGKHVVYSGRVTIGSTTNFNAGTGNMTVSLPVTAVTASYGVMVGNLYLFDASVPGVRAWQAWISATDRFQGLDESGGGTTNTNPWTWTTSDYIDWSILYEAA